ncbi:MAG TPA: phosphoglycerate kinase, partial [Bacteroidetes bacterium]|nr:phosphoglycerate kinase [Bacteroidota bacterium]
MDKLTIQDIDLSGKRVLMRVDFNVPLSIGGVADDTRIRKALPTIRYILEQKSSLVLMSHLGRPKGKLVPEMSLKPVAEHLAELLDREVLFSEDCIGDAAEKQASELKPGEILLLENLRFYKEETDNDPGFSQKLARLGEIYVNDAFGTAHRAHASTAGITKYFNTCVAGFLMEKEINYLAKAVESPEKPFLAILGGAKISGKIDVIQNLLPKVDALLIGGGMAFTFFKAKGLEIGKSLLEPEKTRLAAQTLADAEEKHNEIVLPVDVVCVDDIENPTKQINVDVENMPPNLIGVDIGLKTIALFAEKLEQAKTIVWNGPMGIFEKPDYAKGTFAVAESLADRTEKGAITIVG